MFTASPHQRRAVSSCNTQCRVQSSFNGTRLQAPSTSGLAAFMVRKFSLTVRISFPQ